MNIARMGIYIALSVCVYQMVSLQFLLVFGVHVVLLIQM
jgi:hypothetical protein